MSGKRLKIGEPAPLVEVYDDEGHLVQPAEFWAKGPVLLTFLRHFG